MWSPQVCSLASHLVPESHHELPGAQMSKSQHSVLSTTRYVPKINKQKSELEKAVEGFQNKYEKLM